MNSEKVSEKKNKEKKNVEKKTTYAGQSFSFIMAAMALMFVLLVATVVIFTLMMRLSNSIDAINDIDYNQHYVFIADDRDQALWKAVYESAKEEAVTQNIYLEDLSDTLGVNYSTEDLLRIAVNSSVDGIIYGGASSDGVLELINRAVDEGIGVTILQKDMDYSARQCFVGANNYELGRIYGSQIVAATGSSVLPVTEVELLIDGDISEGALNILIMGIEEYVQEHDTRSGREINITTTRIYSGDAFSVDELIRGMFLERSELPEVIICLNSMYTKSVYQAVVDYNKVGETAIIGYYADEATLDAIVKRILFSTISIDTHEMGVLAIGALDEFHEHGYTSSFVSVDIDVYDYDNATKALSDKEVAGDD